MRRTYDTSEYDGPDTRGPRHECVDTCYGYCDCSCHDDEDCGCDCCRYNSDDYYDDDDEEEGDNDE